MATTLGFYGAARSVTGSRHLLTVDGKRILLDCGMFQGRRSLRERNWEPFPVPPSEVDAVVLSHAHTDHIGWLPRLIRNGYRGEVECTASTEGLAKISLPDGGRIQEEEARNRNRKRATRHQPALPLFTEADARAALRRFRPHRYRTWFDLPGGCRCRFSPSGHIVGASIVELDLPNQKRIVFSGDIGRYDRPILHDPTPIPRADYLLVESTYGDRLHPETDPKSQLAEVFSRAVLEGGVVLVPSFAIGRTQELLWYVHELIEEGRMPRIPIYVDSPMANKTTLLTTKATDDHDMEMRADLREGRTPLRPDMVRMVRDRNMSKSLNSARGPFAVIAGSGMLSGGRIVHHLMRRVGDPKTTVLFTGYQAEGTKGRRLLEGADTISFYKRPFEVRARVESLQGLSAHGDQNELMRWMNGFEKAPERVFLVHGEIGPQETLAARIRDELGWKVSIPDYGDERRLD